MAQENRKEITEYSYYSIVKVVKKKELRTYSNDGKVYVNSLDIADYLDIDNEEAKTLIMLCEQYAPYTLYDENDNTLIESTVIWVEKAEAEYIVNNFNDMGIVR